MSQAASLERITTNQTHTCSSLLSSLAKQSHIPQKMKQWELKIRQTCPQTSAMKKVSIYFITATCLPLEMISSHDNVGYPFKVNQAYYYSVYFGHNHVILVSILELLHEWSTCIYLAINHKSVVFMHCTLYACVGPFFIVTEYDDGNEKVYFKAEGCNINATTDKSEASQFCIKHEEGNHFRVSRYEVPSGNRVRLVSQISGMSEWCVPTFYLTAQVNWRGYSCRNHPLQLQLQDTNDHRSYSYLAFCEQKVQSSGRSEEVELVESERWFNGKDLEAFYIKCSMEPDTLGKSSYLCVQRKTTWKQRQIVYSTGCVPGIRHHNLRQGRSMLFKLVKASEDYSVEIQTTAKSGRRVVVDGESAATTNEGQETT